MKKKILYLQLDVERLKDSDRTEPQSLDNLCELHLQIVRQMKLYYLTLNTSDEARTIGYQLLEKKLAVCVNWFPITCAYLWQGKISEEPEVVLIIKTQDGYGEDIQQLIRQHISYTNFIAEISPSTVNQNFLDWLNTEIPPRVLPQ